MRLIIVSFCLVILLPVNLFGQDTLYAREIINYLSSKKCFGRGYVKNGSHKAANFIKKELVKNKAMPFFSNEYFQDFYFDVNTFPGKLSVKLNDVKLKPGIDFIVAPESSSLKGKYNLQKKDSVSYTAVGSYLPLTLSLKNKLTYSVATKTVLGCRVEILNTKNSSELKTIEVNIKSTYKKNYLQKNICAFIPGSLTNDSLIVFSAHYDHLGGMGKTTFFPGANDNASGVSVLLNLIRHYQKNPPKYKTVFIFFAGEEAGLLGSKYFVESKIMDLSKIKFLVNLDLLGTGDDGIMVVNGYTYAKQFELLNNINNEQLFVKEIKKRGKASNSDHYWFTEAGVPCFFIYTLGGVKAYHDVFDVSETLPLTDYVDVFKLITSFINQL